MISGVDVFTGLEQLEDAKLPTYYSSGAKQRATAHAQSGFDSSSEQLVSRLDIELDSLQDWYEEWIKQEIPMLVVKRFDTGEVVL